MSIFQLGMLPPQQNQDSLSEEEGERLIWDKQLPACVQASVTTKLESRSLCNYVFGDKQHAIMNSP